MRYYRGSDYFIYFEDLKHPGVPGLIIDNTDGTATIYINTLCSKERQERAIQHELRHFVKNHLHIDWMSIQEKEAEADNLKDTSCTFGENFSYVECEELSIPTFPRGSPETCIPCFGSLEELGTAMGKPSLSAFNKVMVKVPAGAKFGVRLQGDSMAPSFPDGCTVFCDQSPISAGNIGIFQVGSGIVCKQYYKDPAGFIYLFSLNPKPKWADMLISPNKQQDFSCLGRVITKKRFPIPGKEFFE